eukprot:8281668-Lingulodinium_polyedra.AAC.1
MQQARRIEEEMPSHLRDDDIEKLEKLLHAGMPDMSQFAPPPCSSGKKAPAITPKEQLAVVAPP